MLVGKGEDISFEITTVKFKELSEAIVIWLSLKGSWGVGGAMIARMSLGGISWLNDEELASLDMAS